MEKIKVLFICHGNICRKAESFDFTRVTRVTKAKIDQK